ncbi:MAG: flagellar basal body rod protein FlgB [Bacilli bacterium]
MFNGVIQQLQNGISYSSAQHKTIAKNIANQDTPNYRAQQVSFQQFYSDAVLEAKQSDRLHISFSKYRKPYSVTSQNGGVTQNNGNNVDVEKEMVLLAENQIYYNALIDRINGKFNSLNSVIRGGK